MSIISRPRGHVITDSMGLQLLIDTDFEYGGQLKLAHVSRPYQVGKGIRKWLTRRILASSFSRNGLWLLRGRQDSTTLVISSTKWFSGHGRLSQRGMRLGKARDVSVVTHAHDVDG